MNKPLPTINMVMVCKIDNLKRKTLTLQCLKSLRDNTTGVGLRLTIVDDCGEVCVSDLPCGVFPVCPTVVIRLEFSDGVLGRLRNLGAEYSRMRFGDPDYYYFSDNDAYFTTGWAGVMTSVLGGWNEHNMYAGPQIAILGGCNHHYHQPTVMHEGWNEYGAVAATSHMMPRSVHHTRNESSFTKLGVTYVTTGAPGVCQSEDHELCQWATSKGYLVGAIDPPVVYDCGITQTNGQPSPGHDTKPRYGEEDGVVYL